jgi:hypothetical protein
LNARLQWHSWLTPIGSLPVESAFDHAHGWLQELRAAARTHNETNPFDMGVSYKRRSVLEFGGFKRSGNEFEDHVMLPAAHEKF